MTKYVTSSSTVHDGGIWVKQVYMAKS